MTASNQQTIHSQLLPEEALQQSQKELADMLRKVADGRITMDAARERFTYAPALNPPE